MENKKDKVKKIGQYSNSQNAIIVDSDGLSNTLCSGGKGHEATIPKIIHKCVDRNKNQYSESETAFTIPANPMSDTVQMVKEQIPINATEEGLVTTITTAHHYSGNIVNPKRGQKEMGVMEVSGCYLHDSEKFAKKPLEGASRTLKASKHDAGVIQNENGKKYRIRKLTERECFRLMGVDDKDIDTIQESGVSRSQQYKMAGNSIVVDVLYHLFRKMFVETGNESRQLTLF